MSPKNLFQYRLKVIFILSIPDRMKKPKNIYSWTQPGMQSLVVTALTADAERIFNGASHRFGPKLEILQPTLLSFQQFFSYVNWKWFPLTRRAFRAQHISCQRFAKPFYFIKDKSNSFHKGKTVAKDLCINLKRVTIKFQSNGNLIKDRIFFSKE